jgi:hypothetical protein
MEANMQKILTALVASVALVAAVSASQACDFHNMSTTAGAGQPEAVVAMSTARPPTIAEDATAKATTECAAGAKGCPQAGK